MASTRCRGDEVTGAICSITAAGLLDLIEPEDGVIYVLSTRRVQHERAGYAFCSTTRLLDEEVVDWKGIKVTDPVRTFLDLCNTHPYRATAVFKRGLRKALLTPEGVSARIDKESRQGRRGIALARSIVEKTDPSASEAKSAKEDHYFELLLHAGYPPPRRNFKVCGSYGHDWEIDLYYPQAAFGFEISPYDTHMDPKVNARDARKELDLEALGIRIVRITDGLSDDDFRRQARRILGPPEGLLRGA